MNLLEHDVNAQLAIKGYSDVKVNAAIASACPHELIQMLYDGLLERIAQVKGSIEQKNIELKGVKVNQAVSIVLGLRDALDQKQGYELSSHLDGLYDYVMRQLWQAHLKNDPAILDECTYLITQVSEAWRAIKPQQY